jgi:hypothetical protein
MLNKGCWPLALKKHQKWFRWWIPVIFKHQKLQTEEFGTCLKKEVLVTY